MHDRLIELIRTASHELTTRCVGECGECADKIADYLLANGVIVPPCNVGDEIYMLVTKHSVSFDIKDHVMTRCKKQHTFTFIKQTRLMESNFFRVIKDIGKTVFLTREEAEAALKGGAE